MNPQTEFLQLIAETAEASCNLFASVSLEELPAEGGLYAELGAGFIEERYFDKTVIKVLPVMFLAKSMDQKEALEALASICNYFDRLKEYPSGDSFAWLDAEISKEPSKIGRDEDGMIYYSCILQCKIHY